VDSFLGGLAAAISVVTTLPYIRDTAKGRTTPHVFTWLVWTLTGAIAFGAQVVGGAGPGAWRTGCMAVLIAVILVMSIRQGETQITTVDWWSLIGCGVAGALWALTENPTLSIILVSFIDAVAYVPTYRKSWHKPGQETLSNYAWGAITQGLALAALSHYNLVTTLYPTVLLMANAGLAALLIARRRSTEIPLPLVR